MEALGEIQIKEEVMDCGFVEVDSYDVHQLCTACLCATRTTHTLDDVTLKQHYMNILTEMQPELGEPVLQSPRLCWECMAHLKRSVRFREQVQDSHKLLQPMLLTCGREYLSEFLQTSVCRPGRLGTCLAHAINISPQFGAASMMTAESDGADDKEPLVTRIKQEIGLETAVAPLGRGQATIATIYAGPSTARVPAGATATTYAGPSTAREPAGATATIYAGPCTAREPACTTDEETVSRSTSRETTATAATTDDETVSQYLVEVEPLSRMYGRPKKTEKQQTTRAKRRKPVNNTKTSNTHRNSHKCEVCKKIFLRKCNLHRHMYTHTGVKPYQCDMCQKTFSIKNNLVVHFRTHTGERPFKCRICQKAFSDKSQLPNHYRVHTGEKPYQCDVCQKSYCQKVNLVTHMRKHFEQPPFQCRFCQKICTHKFYLEIHEKTQHSEENFIKIEVDATSLNQNRNAITDSIRDLNNQCNICLKLFSHKSAMKRHLRLHTGEKPFQCDECQKSFTQSSHLLAHMRTHTGEKPFQCELCQRSFAQQANLISHVRTHTGEKPFRCRECGKDFKSNYNLTLHMRSHTRVFARNNTAKPHKVTTAGDLLA